MPYLTIKMMEGRSDETKKLMVSKLTVALVDSLNINSKDVRIEIEELKEGTFAVDGKMAIKKTE